MQTDRELNHFVGRNALSLVFWMRQTCVRKVEGEVKLILCHGLIRRKDHGILIPHLLHDALCFVFVRFLLNVSEILRLKQFVLQTFLMRMKNDVVGFDASRNLLFGQQKHRLSLRKTKHEIAESLATDMF